VSKLNVKEICQPLLQHATTVLSAGLDFPLSDHAIDYGHDNFFIFKYRKNHNAHIILNAYVLPCHNGHFLKVGIEGDMQEYQALYSTLINKNIVDEAYLENIMQAFFDVGKQWNQFDSVEYHPKDLSVESLTTENRRRKLTNKKHLSMFYYSDRSRRAEQRRRFSSSKVKASHSICTMSLHMSTYSGELAPVYVLNIPLLADIKFTMMVDINKGITDEALQLLLYKYENCIRVQLYEIIKRNLRLRSHENFDDLKDYSMQELVDYVIVTEMASY